MGEIAPRVFLSYSTKDWVLAHLIIHIFEENGIKCFIAERDIPIGAEFDTEIARRIWNSHLLVILLTSHAVASPWIHQEAGIAKGQDIPVWPIAVEDIKIEGAIFRIQGFYFARHTDPYTQVVGIANEIKLASKRAYKISRPAVDQYIFSKIARTNRLIDIMREESQRAHTAYVWRMQAIFSSFSISSSPDYRVNGYHTEEYYNLLLQELQLANQIANKAHLRVIVWPIMRFRDRQYHDYARIRFRALIDWLENDHNYDRVRFVISDLEEKNAYIFDANILVEGFKSPDSNTRGYQLTTITYHGPTISEAIESFDARFNELWKQHAAAHETNADPHLIRRYVIQELKRLHALI